MINLDRFTRNEKDGRLECLVSCASDCGFPPGKWPRAIAVQNGLHSQYFSFDKWMQDAEGGEIQGATYKSVLPHVAPVHIFND